MVKEERAFDKIRTKEDYKKKGFEWQERRLEPKE